MCKCWFEMMLLFFSDIHYTILGRDVDRNGIIEEEREREYKFTHYYKVFHSLKYIVFTVTVVIV